MRSAPTVIKVGAVYRLPSGNEIDVRGEAYAHVMLCRYTHKSDDWVGSYVSLRTDWLRQHALAVGGMVAMPHPRLGA